MKEPKLQSPNELNRRETVRTFAHMIVQTESHDNVIGSGVLHQMTSWLWYINNLWPIEFSFTWCTQFQADVMLEVIILRNQAAYWLEQAHIEKETEDRKYSGHPNYETRLERRDAHFAALTEFVKSPECREAVAQSTSDRDTGGPGARLRLHDDGSWQWGKHPDRLPGSGGKVLIVPGLSHEEEADLEECGNLTETGEITDLDVYEGDILKQMQQEL